MAKVIFKRSRILMASLMCMAGLTSVTDWAHECEAKLAEEYL